jgi:putative inorganic carbon (HCO3(-)) transporter
MASWPLWVWAWLVLTVFFFVLRAGGAIQSVPLCFFLSAVAGAVCFSLDQLRFTGSAHPLLRLRQVVLVVVLVALPSVFDPTTVEIENLPRLVVVVVAAVLIVSIWAVDAVWSQWRPRRLVNGFQWVLLAIVVWFGVTTLTSVEPRLSLLGQYGSYEGLLLLAALAVVACALAECFKAESLPALFRMVVASTVPTLVYGVIQVYGFDVDKNSKLDFVTWPYAFHNVFTTLGNPNHMAGFLVTVLPLGVVTAVLANRRWLRVVLWVWVAIALVLLLQTACRGAWLGALAAGAILIVAMLPRLRAHARMVGLVGGSALIVVVGLLATGSHFLGKKASDLFQFGSGSSVSQRYGAWTAAVNLGFHHLLVGTGPDTFAATYSRYQGATLANQLGATYFVNGAHDIFLSWLANEGIPGLLLIAAILVFGVGWGARMWLSFRVRATDRKTTAAKGPRPEEARGYMVAALVAALVGYFVQACFDIEQVATLFVLFVVLGFLGVANRGTWPVATLVGTPFRLRGLHLEAGVPKAEDDPGYPIGAARARTRSAAQSRRDRWATALAVGAVGLTAVALTFWRADALWRADHQAWVRSDTSAVQAIKLNPWEPSYYINLGQAAEHEYGADPKSTDAVPVLREAVDLFRQAANLDGADTYTQTDYGGALLALATVEHSNKALARMSLAALSLAEREDPFNATVPGFFQADEKILKGPVPNVTAGCSPMTNPSSSGTPASTLTSTDTEVASGTVGGEPWSLWSTKGQSGARGIEEGGLVLGGRAYGLCPGFPNPAEMELIDAGPSAVVAGVVDTPGLAKVALSESTPGTFDVGRSLPSPSVRVVDGVSFFIGTLPESACDYHSLELTTTSPGFLVEHNLGFGPCVAGQLVPISESRGIGPLPSA